MKPSSSESGYELVTLVSRPEGTIQFSPFVWKTIMELRYLNIPFTQRHLTFDGVRNELAKELGDESVSVPLLKDDEGEWIEESFDIALYLDQTHAVPKGKSLFLHGVGGREFCRFVNYWTDTSVMYGLGGPFGLARTYTCLEPDSAAAEYYLSSRYSGSLSAFTAALKSSMDPQVVSDAMAKSRQTLQLAESMLKYQSSQGKKFLGGDFSHADAALFSMYLYSKRFAPEVDEGVWKHEDLPSVRAWIGAVMDLGVVTKEEVEAVSWDAERAATFLKA